MAQGTLDVSEEMIQVATEFLGDRNNVHLRLTDGVGLSALSELEFDFIFSAIVFQHIPRKSIVKNYIRDASALLRSGGVFKFQVSGVPIKARYANTWDGIGFTEAEMGRMAKRFGYSVSSFSGAGTQYFWVTLVKQ